MGGKSSKGDITKKGEEEKNPKDGKDKDKDEKDKKEDEKPAVPPVPYTKLFRFATTKDKFFVMIAFLSAMIGGLSMPLMVIFFGRITKAMVDQGSSGPLQRIPLYCPATPVIPTLPDSTTPMPVNQLFLDEVSSFGLYMTILGVATLALSYIHVSLFNIVSENIVYRLRREYLQGLLRQNVGWYDTVQDKNFVSRISEDLVKVQEATGEKVGLCIFFMATCLLSLGNAFYHGWKLTLVVLSSAPVLAIASGIVASIQTKLATEEQTSYAKAGNVAEEALTNVRTVVAFSGCDKEIQRYEDGLAVAKAAAKKRGAISAFGVGLMWFIIYASYALAFWYGTKLILEGRPLECAKKMDPNYTGKDPEYTADTLLIVFFSVLMGAFNIGQSASYFEAFAVGRGSAAVIYSVIDRTPEIDSYSEEGKKPSARSTGKISFHDVVFNYPSRPDVEILKKFSLTVSSGQTVALVGHSGCGKSTILQLLQRFYDPQDGKVCVDGENIKTLHLGWLRSQIGVVSQEPVLFNTTILENIQYGREDVSMKDVEEACRQANAHGFISKLPNGYNTIVGDRGAQLSGGQKQRIAIARALVRNPAILLLDEATSALDTQSESVVQAALDRARKGRTTLIVAHRLSTIRSADVVVAINEGQLAEKGTHHELLKEKGLYHSLVLAQMQGRGEDIDETEEDIAERQEMLDKSLAEISRKSIGALDDEDVVPFAATVSEGLIDEAELAKEAPIMRLIKMNSPEWKSMVLGIISSIIQGCLLPMYAVLFGEFIGILSKPSADYVRTEANKNALLFLGLGSGAGLSMFIQMFMFTIAGEALTNRLRKLTFHAMLKQEMGWFDDPNNNIGALCARLSGDAAHVQGATGSRVGTVVQSLSTIVLAVGLALYYDLKLGAVAMCFTPLVVVATYFQMKLMTGQNIVEKNAVDDASKIAVQAVGNIRTVASLCKEKAFVKMYNSFLVTSHRQIINMAHLRGFIFGFAQAVPFFAYGTVMYYGGQLIENEGLPYERVFKVGEALIFGTMMIGQAMAFAPNYNKAKVSGARILRLLDRQPLIDSSPGVGLRINNAVGSVQFDKVAFNYPTRPTAQILLSLSYGVEPGKSIALVGPSGCGKSTCIQLILRFYDPLSGEVKLDEQVVAGLNVDSLRSQMAIVAQEPALFDRTIAQNIAYGDNSRQVSMDEIIDAAKQANIHSFIASLPSGYETRVGEQGTQLSGGQKQRVAIARALVRKPKVLLLDEATSALDTESEQVVQAALDAAASGRTSITIAHRLSSIQNVDKILVINQGELYESGTHAELLKKQGLYYRLWNMQGQSGNAKKDS